MPVEVWTGGPFTRPQERLAQNRLIESLQARFGETEGTVFAIFNISVTGKDVPAADLDLLILKRDAITIVDFKECGAPVTATENGTWQINGGGTLNGNPYQQVRQFRFSLNAYLLEHKSEFLPKQKASGLTNHYALLNFIRSVVALCPKMHPDTVNRITPNPWFHITGLDRLPELLQAITSTAFLLDDSEMRSLARDVLSAEPLLGTPPDTPKQVAPNIRRHIRDYSTIIEDKTRDFVGRQFVLDEIDAFLASADRGYFTIYGDPGIGKSAVAARLVATRGYLHHFNIQAEGINRVEAFLANVCSQLIARYQLDHDTLPADATSDAGFLNSLLIDVAARSTTTDKVVIVVDALDEVNRIGVLPTANLLYLPTVLPPNVYFILTTRRTADLPRFDCEHRATGIAHDSPENVADIRRYVASCSQRPRLQSYIAARGLSPEAFVDLMAVRSEGSFIYLRCVLPEIESGGYRDHGCEAIPAGLQGYYDDHWRRMQAGAKDTWFEHKLPILAALTAVQEPVSLDLLCEFSGISERIHVQAVLGEWRQFLHTIRVDTGERGISERFCLYHKSYFDYLKAKEEVSAERFDLKVARKRIADALWTSLHP